MHSDPRSRAADRDTHVPANLDESSETWDAREPLPSLLHDLDVSASGLSAREASRRWTQYGPNVLVRKAGPSWARDLVAQFTHPLALLLWLAAALAAVSHNVVLGYAIVAVIFLNAVFAFAQERQAEKAVEALAGYLPQHASVRRDGARLVVPAAELVPGDVLLVEAGDRVSADARLLDGAVEVDMSALTGESAPNSRTAAAAGERGPYLYQKNLIFSGTICTAGEATAVVVATGMSTEIGRIAALSQRVGKADSPLESQVKRVAWLIAAVAVGAGLAFVPIGTLVAGLPLPDAATFAIGLLVANVPEGLLPIITLALAAAVRELASRGAIVKRLSAVETLGSTTVICTDKTGTLTLNRMRVVSMWTSAGVVDMDRADAQAKGTLASAALVCAACNDAELGGGAGVGDPTEIALLNAAAGLGADTSVAWRVDHRLARFAFDPTLRRMTTVDRDEIGPVVHVKGAPEEILARSGWIASDVGDRTTTDADRRAITEAIEEYASHGLRVLALACRRLESSTVPCDRSAVERDLTFVGMAAMFDPPRPEVAQAARRCRDAGVRMIVVTGDNGRTAAELARRIGVVGPDPTIVTGVELDSMPEPALDDLLRARSEIVFARTSPEAKLRIADALRDLGNVVAMTGDGVNDAPALRRADIGVAMGEGGTDVAREAATMVLTDDNFATIVAAIEAGRRVYDNVRKFIVYIFAHATPEVAPFLIYALSGGAIPLPLTVLQILAIDLGTETLPALALGREPAEPGLMSRPPRPRSEGVVSRTMLLRSWLLLGGVSTVLVTGGYFVTLLAGGWTWGAPTGPGDALHHVWRQATTMTFLGIVACQVGTAVAARTQRASLRAIGVFSNRLLLWGIGFELAFAAAVVWLPVGQRIFGTAPPGMTQLLLLAPFPILVWGADELWRAWRRRSDGASSAAAPSVGEQASLAALR